MKRILILLTSILLMLVTTYNVFADESRYSFEEDSYPWVQYDDSEFTLSEINYDFDERMALEKVQWSDLDKLPFKEWYPCRPPIPFMTYVWMDFERGSSAPDDFYQPVRNATYSIVKVTGEPRRQIVDKTNRIGFVLTPATVKDYIVFADHSLKQGETIEEKDFLPEERSVCNSYDVYLLESYFIKDEKLYAMFGDKQKPLQVGKEYLIKDRCFMVNADDFPSDLPIEIFDEQNFWNLTDLKEDEAYNKKLTDTGLYKNYADIQYAYVREVLTRYWDYHNYSRGTNDPLPYVFDDPAPTIEPTVEPTPTAEPTPAVDPTTELPTGTPNDHEQEPEPEKPSWFLPAAIGFGAGALVCLVPTAVVLLVKAKKRKKAAAAEADGGQERH